MLKKPVENLEKRLLTLVEYLGEKVGKTLFSTVFVCFYEFSTRSCEMFLPLDFYTESLEEDCLKNQEGVNSAKWILSATFSIR